MQANENGLNENAIKPSGKLFNYDKKGKKEFIKLKPSVFWLEMTAKYFIPGLYLLFVIFYFALYLEF